jgi:hypothetical protein
MPCHISCFFVSQSTFQLQLLVSLRRKSFDQQGKLFGILNVSDSDFKENIHRDNPREWAGFHVLPMNSWSEPCANALHFSTVSFPIFAKSRRCNQRCFMRLRNETMKRERTTDFPLITLGSRNREYYDTLFRLEVIGEGFG